MRETYVHGYRPRENERLQDQAGALVDLLHSDTAYPAGSMVLEAGCGVGAQTVTLAQRSRDARFTSVDLSADSIAEATRRAGRAGLTNVEFRQADIFALPFNAESFDHVFVCFVLEHLPRPVEALAILGRLLRPTWPGSSCRPCSARSWGASPPSDWPCRSRSCVRAPAC